MNIRKIAKTFVSAIILRYGEYLLMPLAIAICLFLRDAGWSFLPIFLTLWVGCLTIDVLVVGINDRFDVDITLMETVGSMVGWVQRRQGRLPKYLKPVSWFVITLMETCIVIWLAFWHSAAAVYKFLERYCWVRDRKYATLVVGSGIQMFIWTGIYLMGIDNSEDIGDSLTAVWNTISDVLGHHS